MISTWQAALSEGKSSEEQLLSIDQSHARRLLILPALFDEANKMRRFTVQLMRQLDAAEIDSFLPDFPGCNESLEPGQDQTLRRWRELASHAAESFGVTGVLTIRAGNLYCPRNLPGWNYAPLSGPKMLRSMLRARTIAARESGREETAEGLTKLGREEGLTLAGWPIGPEMLRELESAESITGERQAIIKQQDLGGAGLWLRAEPAEDEEQAIALARIVSDSWGDLE